MSDNNDDAPNTGWHTVDGRDRPIVAPVSPIVGAEREALLRCEEALRALVVNLYKIPYRDLAGLRADDTPIFDTASAALTLLDEARAALGDST